MVQLPAGASWSGRGRCSTPVHITSYQTGRCATRFAVAGFSFGGSVRTWDRPISSGPGRSQPADLGFKPRRTGDGRLSQIRDAMVLPSRRRRSSNSATRPASTMQIRDRGGHSSAGRQHATSSSASRRRTNRLMAGAPNGQDDMPEFQAGYRPGQRARHLDGRTSTTLPRPAGRQLHPVNDFSRGRVKKSTCGATPLRACC